jgi:hypothetical protein
MTQPLHRSSARISNTNGTLMTASGQPSFPDLTWPADRRAAELAVLLLCHNEEATNLAQIASRPSRSAIGW